MILDLVAGGVPWPAGLNLNGAVLTPDGRHVVACQTNLGRFWRVALDTGKVGEVALDGGPLEHCDGLAISGPALYVAVNARNRIAVASLAEDGAEGRVHTILSSDAFAFPTAVAVGGGRLLAALWQLYRDGVVREMYSPGRPGAVLVLEAAGPREAEAAVAGLPLAEAGLIVFEVIELHPFSALQVLFAGPVRP